MKLRTNRERGPLKDKRGRSRRQWWYLVGCCDRDSLVLVRVLFRTRWAGKLAARSYS